MTHLYLATFLKQFETIVSYNGNKLTVLDSCHHDCVIPLSYHSTLHNCKPQDITYLIYTLIK